MLKNLSKKKKTIYTIVLIAFVFYSITLIYPFIWLTLNSFKLQSEFMNNPFGFPYDFTFVNYNNVFGYEVNNTKIYSMLLNSLILVIGCVACSIFSSCCTAYVISKYKFKGRNFLYNFAIILMVIPTIGSTAATYATMNELKLIDTYFCIFIMALGGFNIPFLMLYSYFKNISWSYAEAAMVDGASPFCIYLKIMMPQAKPALVAIAIIQSIGFWNDYITPYMYLESKPTIAVGLELINSAMSHEMNFPLLFAAMIISTIPVFCVFCRFQKVIMNNTSAGGLKG